MRKYAALMYPSLSMYPYVNPWSYNYAMNQNFAVDSADSVASKPVDSTASKPADSGSSAVPKPADSGSAMAPKPADPSSSTKPLSGVPASPGSTNLRDELVLDNKGIPLTGYASTTTFTDASMTACGNRWDGTYKTADGKCGRNFTMHGPLSTISSYWWDKQFNALEWVENADGSGKCDTPGYELCYKLTPIKSGSTKFANDKLPPPVVVKVGDRCGDRGWCDGTDDTASSTTRKDFSVEEAVNSKTAWDIDFPTRMHFDLMAGSFPMDHEWSNFNYNKATNGNWNFLVKFERVDCSQHKKIPSGVGQFASGCECDKTPCNDLCKDRIGQKCK